MADRIRFVLNDQPVELDGLSPMTTLLDWLREHRGLRGTKEGCAEGDCGACTVLVGRLSGDELVYETVNACICFVGMLHGTHVVTIEHLSPANGPLHPVQQAMVDYHGSQCGFCTPGIVMSLYGLWMQEPQPSTAAIEKALQGNLCRCTGYAPIIKAGKNDQDSVLADARTRLLDLVGAIERGELPPRPYEPRICSYCAYPSVCRKDYVGDE